MQHIYLDYETFSDIDIKVHGLRRYVSSPVFDILLCAIGRFTENGRIVEVYDLTTVEGKAKFDAEVRSLLLDATVVKHAWNAQFERVCTEQVLGVTLDARAWHCTMAKSLYCGLPASLDECGRMLDIDNVKKAAEGKKLIRTFCVPRKPTKRDSRTRITWRYSDTDLKAWQDFKLYNEYDVLAEMDIEQALACFDFPEVEQKLYELDQHINETGIGVDTNFAKLAHSMCEAYKTLRTSELQQLSGLSKVGSAPQLKQWLLKFGIPIPTKTDKATGETVETLDKAAVKELLSNHSLPQDVIALLEGRQQLSKSSNAKYEAITHTVSDDGRIRGLLQYYGANRTGRWAGRLVQLHNLPQNHIPELDAARLLVYEYDGDLRPMEFMFGDVPSILSQLIRTAFVAPQGQTFVVADFSAIEARVTAWYAAEQWRLDVFSSHGKIYEASAAQMFGIPIEQVTKDSEWRVKGKVAELAFGFGGSVNAAKAFGADTLGLSDDELAQLVADWREASPGIVRFWQDCHTSALQALGNNYHPVKLHHELEFCRETNGTHDWLTVKLPSGRKLYYFKPHKVPGRFSGESLAYWSADSAKTYVPTSTFGGKLVENIVQATARDLLAYKMRELDAAGYCIVLHVHDEIVVEVPANGADIELECLLSIMSDPVSWAPGLPLNAAGYVTPYYKKD